MASCGDFVTAEVLAATTLLHEHLPQLKIRFIIDLFKLIFPDEHPHGFKDHESKAIFTSDKPIIFNFHSYPGIIHRRTYHCKGQHNLRVRGYRGKGNIDTPLELAICNGIDRFSLAIGAIDHLPALGNKGGVAREISLDKRVKAKTYAFPMKVWILRTLSLGRGRKISATRTLKYKT